MAGKKRGRAGQVSVFIIIGIIILIAAGLAVFLMALLSSREDAGEAPALQRKATPLQRFVEKCLEDVAAPGAYLLAAQGGFIFSYETFLNAEHEQIAYHLSLGEPAGPPRAFMEAQLARFIEQTLPLCTGDLAALPEGGFENVTLGTPNASVSINEQNLIITVKQPLALEQDGSEALIEDFTATLPLRLGHLLDIRDAIIAQLQNEETLALDALSSYDVEVSVLPYNKDTSVFSLYDPQSVIDDAPFHLNFAVRIVGNVAPRLEFIPDFVVTKGKPFAYQVTASDADGDALSFSSANEAVRIDAASGALSFTPAAAGTAETEVCVRDSAGARDCEGVKFIVE